MNFSEEIHKIPFVRLIIPLIAGILFQIGVKIDQRIIFFLILFLALLFIIGSFIHKKKRNSITVFIVDRLNYIILFAFGLYLVSRSESQLENFEDKDISNGFIIAEINEPPAEKEKSVKVKLTVIAIKNADSWEYTEGKLVAYFEKDSASEKLNYGDRLLLDANFTDIEGPKNPEEFDYKKYMAYHLISKQSYIKSGNWKILDQNKGNRLISITSSFREKIIGIYSESGIQGQELAVLSALTLGYKDKLDAETKKSYAASGAMHMLAVSGLHIGIIYLILNTILFFIPERKGWKLLKVSIILIALWFYAFMTGLPPSAKRASVMFSMVAIGNVLERKPNIYNTLAASAFILLIQNPFSLMEAGFQLSYLAVVGIVFFQPRLSAIFTFKNKILNWLWELICVSIAAQIATAPIAMYYFHQFPNYFLLTNIIVIPAAFLLIYNSLILLIFSFSRIITSLFASIEIELLKALNSAVKLIEDLPYSMIENISISSIQVFLTYLAIFLAAVFIMYKYHKLVKYIMICFIIVFNISTCRYYNSLNQNYFIIYNIHNTSAYNYIRGKNNLLITNVSVEQQRIDFHIKSNWIKLGADREEIIYLNEFNEALTLNRIKNKLKILDIYYRKGIMAFREKTFVLYNEQLKPINLKNTFQIDYIILSDNSCVSIDQLISNYNFNYLVFDSSIKHYKLKKLKKDCELLHIPYFSVKDKGAFVLKL